MKTLNANRLFALFVAFVLALMVAAPSAQAAPVPVSQPVYVSCISSSGLPAHLLVFFDLNDQSGLTRFLDDAYYNPSSPSFHQFLSASQFDAQYSAPAGVVGVVGSVISFNRLTTITKAPMLIEASGTDVQVQSTITQLSSEPASIQKYIIGAECIPETIDPASSTGDQLPSYTPTDIRGAYVGTSPLSTGQGVTGPNNCSDQIVSSGAQVWLPCGLQTIYDANPLLQQGISGSRETIALVDAYGDPQTTLANEFVYDNIACSDLATFDATFNLPSSSCSVIYPTGVPVLTSTNYQDAEGWAPETGIDMQYSHTMAPQARILEVTASTDGDDLFASVEYVINNQLANTISLSWGQWEDLYYYPPSMAAFLLGYDEILQQAAAQGIGVFVSSGDYAAYDPILQEVSASAPATDPWVSGVGGTTLNATFTASSVFRLEHAWSLGSDSYCLACGSGGGFSMLFEETLGQQYVHISTQGVSSIPEHALGITFYPQGMRGVPDLAADADPTTGVLIVQDGTISPYVWGGTSLAAPLTAGMTTTVQSNIGFTIGDLAPSLYLLYLQEGHGFYVSQSQFTLSQLSHGVPGVMFKTAYGQNGPFQVTPGVWNPVDGLGQLNVYGLSEVISSVSYGD